MESRPQLIAPRVERAERAENPFGEVATRTTGGAVAIEQERVIAEAKARLIIARTNPRDPIRAMEMILNDCTRPSLADHAVYQYSRGGTDIRGPTIRLAEAIAQKWGNMASGIKEIARHDGISECMAYAWDLESNFIDERGFQVRHWRDRRPEHGGGYILTDERDIYELIANFGQRRKRAVMLSVIPGDVIEAALQQCESTMRANADTSPEGIKRLVEAFAGFGIEPGQIEVRIQRRIDAIRPAQIVMLRKIYNSISDGLSQAADWFDPIGEAQPATAGEAQAETSTPRRRGRPPGKANAPAAGAAPAEANPTPASPPPPAAEPKAQAEPQPDQAQPARTRVMFE